MNQFSVRAQISINLGFVFIKSFFLLLSIWLADYMLSAATMGFVLLLRRQSAFWGNLLQLGLSQSLQKFYPSNPDLNSRLRLWCVFVRWVGVTALAVFLISVLFGQQLSLLFFGRPNRELALAFSIYVAGVSLGFMAYSSWMVEFKFIHSNIIDWLNGSLIFVFCIFIGSKFSDTYFSFLLALLTLISSIFSLFWFIRQQDFHISHFGISWTFDKPIFYYSLTRGLTAFADIGTITIGPWILKDSPVQAGYLIIAYTVLRVAQTLIMPVS